MYAVVKTGGKQYKVAPGENVMVEKLLAEVGAEVLLDEVLLVSEGDNVRLGQPKVPGATVKATVIAHGRGAMRKPRSRRGSAREVPRAPGGGWPTAGPGGSPAATARRPSPSR